MQIKRQISALSGNLKIDFTLLLTLVALAIINMFIQYSANDKTLNHLINDFSYLVISFIILIIVSHIRIAKLKVIIVPFYSLSLILLIMVILIGTKSHGATRWLNIGVHLQPSELCKLSVPMMVAYYFSFKSKPFKLIDYFVGIIIVLVPFLLIAKQPDLGTAILTLFAGFFVLFFVELPWRLICLGLVALISLTPVIWHFLHDYQKHRILTLLHPQSDPLGAGYHIIQSIIAIGGGGLFGQGYLHGTQIHLNFIPEKHTDFVLSVLAEEFGFVGISVILVLYFILIWRGLQITQKVDDLFCRALAGSITLSFMLYVLINMGMVAGIFPVVGVPLPFISYGGTATLILMTGFGILTAIAKQNRY